MNAQIREIVVEVEVNAPRERVWQAICQEMANWWPIDCLALEGAEKMEFEPWAGGRQFVQNADGHQLLWGTVLTLIPLEYIDIAGFTMPQYGGPSTWFWRMAVTEDGEGRAKFTLSNSIVGRIDDAGVEDATKGWTMIFQGLKQYCES